MKNEYQFHMLLTYTVTVNHINSTSNVKSHTLSGMITPFGSSGMCLCFAGRR